ncbi:hypothetical protein DB30_00927 [Enhygromyxa salina]|uniref:Uncharacterized protein n=1 Tax=Enhygromyxa salina TaxID=215803 RepID=A0A0C2CTC3_9BACT|nr:hypothetical protein [Enhygromyxa salina]KIG12860.1 hypothetical protein DB30_00927 [Enhygromyxa salina]
MSELAITLATEARRAGVVTVLRRYPTLTLESLAGLLHAGPYANVLADLTVADLRRPVLPSPPVPPGIRAGETVEDAVMRAFRGRPGIWMASSFFVLSLDLRRWTAQQVLGDLVDAGQLERRGVTSATRYRLVPVHRLDSGVGPQREGCC